MKRKLSPTNEARASLWSSGGTRTVRVLLRTAVVLAFVATGLVYFSVRGNAQGDRKQEKMQAGFDEQISSNAQEMFRRGREVFRYDTFGDEAYWSDKIKVHQAIQG